jgi:pentalenene oxygenase
MSRAARIPPAGRSAPLLGHTLPLLRDPLGFITALPARGDLVRVRLGPTSTVWVCERGLTRKMLQDDRTFDMGGAVTIRAREVVGVGLGTCAHSQHRRLRRLCQPAFHHQRMPAYGSVMSDVCNATAASWRDGQSIDVNAEAATLVLRVAVDTMFSTGLGPDIARSIGEDFNTVSNPAVWRMFMPGVFSRVPTPGNRRYHRAGARLRRTVGEIITERRAEGTDHGDLLSALLSAQDPESEALSKTLEDQEVVEQITNIFAGAETTNAALASALYLIAEHPGVERRLHAELDAVLDGARPGYEHLPRLELTDRVVTETLRHYTPIWFGTRRVTRDTELGGFRLKAGTMMFWSPYVIHHRPDVYPEPGRFDPDRWLDTKPDKDSYYPFGAGARKCIGNRFAHTTTALALAAIISRWRLRPQSVRIAAKTLLSPRLRMRVIAR